MAATKITNKKTKAAKEEEVLEEANDNFSVHSSGSESGSDSEIDGLSSAEEDDETETSASSTHKMKKLSKKKTSNNKKDKKNSEYSGIIYISRLPQGFQEKELSKYFSQFGDLKEVKLARNKKTGNSRHYGFIEFINKDDAQVAQDAMNNYLLMGHLLQVRVLAKGSKIEKLYRHKKRVYSEAPIKKSAKELKKQSKEKHDQRMQKLSENGIDFKW